MPFDTSLDYKCLPTLVKVRVLLEHILERKFNSKYADIRKSMERFVWDWEKALELLWVYDEFITIFGTQYASHDYEFAEYAIDYKRYHIIFKDTAMVLKEDRYIMNLVELRLKTMKSIDDDAKCQLQAEANRLNADNDSSLANLKWHTACHLPLSVYLFYKFRAHLISAVNTIRSIKQNIRTQDTSQEAIKHCLEELSFTRKKLQFVPHIKLNYNCRTYVLEIQESMTTCEEMMEERLID